MKPGHPPADRRRLRELLDHFAHVSSLDAEERRAFVTGLSETDPAMAAELQAMFDAAGDPHPLVRQLTPSIDRGPADGALDAPLPSIDEISVPGFQLVRLIGSGGMGVVYEAEQIEPRRRVALKVLRPTTATTASIRRFRRESAVLAHLEHPGIAAVFSAGTFQHDGLDRPYFVMELIDGSPILDHALSRRLDRLARVELIVQICDAVEHAHRRGIIHRDLKPANILVTAGGQPKIIDFGIAGEAKSGVLGTIGNTDSIVLGTLPYASPEQLRSDQVIPDTRSDVYSIGVVAYELLGGAPVVETRQRSLAEVLDAVCRHDPVPLGQRDPLLRGDLESIVAKSMEKDPDARYQSALDLLADFRRYLNAEPVQARRLTFAYRFEKLWQRRRATVSIAIAAGLVLLVAIALSISEWVAKEALRDEIQRTFLAVMNQIGRLEDEPTIPVGVKRRMLEDVARETTRLTDMLPDDHDMSVMRATMLNRLGSAAFDCHLLSVARGYQADAEARWRTLVDRDARDRAARRGLSLSIVKLGDIDKEEGDYLAGGRRYASALEIDRQSTRLFPDDAECLDDLGWGCDRNADMAYRHGNLPLALELWREWDRIIARLLVLAPRRPSTFHAGFCCQSMFAQYFTANNDPVPAGMASARRRSFGLSLIALAPTSAYYTNVLQVVKEDEAFDSGVVDPGSIARDSIQQLSQMVASDPTNAEFMISLSICYQRRANHLRACGERRAALVEEFRAIELIDRAEAIAFDRYGTRKLANSSRAHLADELVELGDLAGACRVLDRVIPELGADACTSTDPWLPGCLRMLLRSPALTIPHECEIRAALDLLTARGLTDIPAPQLRAAPGIPH